MKRIAIALSCIAVAAVPATAAQAKHHKPAKPKQPNIVQLASSAPQFSTLVSLVKQAGLVRALSKPGKLTVFAPTNKAFSKVPSDTLDALARDRKQLRAVLLYHVAPGKLTASKVVKRDGAKTLNGARVTFDVRNGKVFVNDARVTKADLKASNGVVHQINRVLLPPM